MWILVLIAVIPAFVVGYMTYRRYGKCEKCGKTVWYKLTDCTPNVSPALSFELYTQRYNCKCGHVSALYMPLGQQIPDWTH